MQRKMKWLALTGIVSSLFIGSQARADLITYTDLNDFLAAAGSTTLEDFNAATPRNFNSPTIGGIVVPFVAPFSNFIAVGNLNGDFVSVAPATFSGPFSGNIDATNFFYFGQIDPQTRESGGDGNEGPAFTYNFLGPTTAFGFDWRDTDGTDSYQLAINEGTFTNPPFVDTFTGRGTGSGFYGVIATNGETFTSAAFTHSEVGGVFDSFGIDNVRVSAAAPGNPAPVPEPGTMALMGVGLASLVAARRRRKIG